MAGMEMISTSQSGKRKADDKICDSVVLWGILESAISQNTAQRDDLTDAFITDRMTGGTHVSFPTTVLA